MSLYELFSLSLSLSLFLSSLSALAAHGGEFMRAVGASQRVFAIIDREPTMSNAGGLSPDAANGEGLCACVSGFFVCLKNN